RVDSFQRFFWSPDHLTWRVQGQDGSQLELGVPLDGSADDNALEANPDRPGEVAKWHLARAYDHRGDLDRPDPQPINVVAYRYINDGGTLYLSDIFDTSPAASPTTSDLAQYANHTYLEYELRP